MTQVLRAKPLIDQKIAYLKSECQKLIEEGYDPNLKVILVGSNPSSIVYTNHKKKFCEQIGAKCEIINLPESIKPDDFLAEIDKINKNPNVFGALIQLPVPKQLQHLDLANLVLAEKDIDGFHQQNVMELFKGGKGHQSLIPCTPKGIVTLLEHYGIEIQGKKVCIIGRSQIVGKPLALLLLNHNATVMMCHSQTKDLKEITKISDIIFCAIGKAKFITEDFIGSNKPIIIDVGTNVDSNNTLVGDVDYDQVKEMCTAITPVPGGIGPMTVYSVVENLILATKLAQSKTR